MKNKHIPLFRNAGFALNSIEHTKKSFAVESQHPLHHENFIYSRYRNPTVTATEQQIMEIESCQWALLTSSGMAAIDLAVSIFSEGEHTKPFLFFSEIYGGTNTYIDVVLKKRRGLNIHHFNAENGTYNMQTLEQILQEVKPVFMYFEAVSNPMLIVADVEAIITLAKKYQVKIIVDNTFATPALWKPLQDGADLVIHSATKYFGGHGNLTAGVLCGNETELFKQALEIRKWVGYILSPDDAARLSDYLKTFSLRFSQQCQNAAALATFLNTHKAVESVLYPGLPEHNTYNNAIKLFKNNGFGAMLTFDLKGTDNADKANKCAKFITQIENNVQLVPSLGDTETILLPVEAVWGQKYPLPGMIRLSLGIENTHTLIQTFNQALNEIVN